MSGSWAHEILFGRKPDTIKEPAVVVVDESAWQDGLFGTTSPVRLLVDTLVNEGATVPGEPLASGQLESTRTNLYAALSQMMNGASDLATLLPVLRSGIVARGIDVAATREAYASEWKRKEEANIFPGMSRKSRKEAVRAVTHNKIVGKLATLWKAVGHLVADDGPEKSGWISIGMTQTTEGTAPTIHIKGRRPVHESWHVPTLMLDATMQPGLVRHYWPTMELTADIRLQAPYQHVRQVRDRSYSKAQLAKTSGLRHAHAIVCREARRYTGRVLVVAQKDVEEALATVGSLPINVETGHHNAVAGRDEWGPGPGRKGIEALIVIGRTAPSPAAVESMAEALTGIAIDPLRGWYEKADAAYEMADGLFRPTETDRHPHITAEAIRWHIAEGELIQIIGRARGVNRTRDNPVDVLVMTNAPLPIPVERLITASDLDPSPADVMMAAGGVSFENPADAATSYQHIWASRNAAKKAMEKHREGILGSNRNKEYLITVRPQDRREGPSHVRVDYQLPGHGKRPSTAWVDPHLVSDPEAWLTERLGPLANFALGPANQEPITCRRPCRRRHGLLPRAQHRPDLLAAQPTATAPVSGGFARVAPGVRLCAAILLNRPAPASPLPRPPPMREPVALPLVRCGQSPLERPTIG